MAKNIRFTASGSCSALGNFAPGDQARNIPDALAHHLVHEAMCAQYLAAPGQPPAVEATPVQPVKKPKSTKAKGSAE